MKAKGYKAKSYVGIPVAIEKHPDGSVTIAKDVIDEILADDIPPWIKDLLK